VGTAGLVLSLGLGIVGFDPKLTAPEPAASVRGSLVVGRGLTRLLTARARNDSLGGAGFLDSQSWHPGPGARLGEDEPFGETTGLKHQFLLSFDTRWRSGGQPVEPTGPTGGHTRTQMEW
jgi:hypothetical protein